MFKPLTFAIALVATAPASSQPAVPGQTPVVTVVLSNFRFEPNTIHLAAGQPVILRLSNTSSGGHDFGAPAFFAAATVNPGDAKNIRKGQVQVGARQSVDISLTPSAGTYALKCDHPFHSTFGMKGQITVD